VRSYVFEYDDANLARQFQQEPAQGRGAAFASASPATELYRHTFDYEMAPPPDGMFAGESDWGVFSQADGNRAPTTGSRMRRMSSMAPSGSFGIGLLVFSDPARAPAATGRHDAGPPAHRLERRQHVGSDGAGRSRQA
jgi:hypothetical protein